MSESVQAVLGLLLIVGTLGSVFAIMGDRVHWSWLAGMPALALGSLGLLVWSLLRKDKVPDFLKSVPGPLLERDGFCFKVLASPIKGRCYLEVHFQSRYEGPSRAIVVLQPSKGFFLTRPDLGSVTVEVACPPGGAGLTGVPWPVARKFQGKVQRLDVGADVLYPEGRGRMVRYRGGLQVRTAGRDTWRAIMTVAGAMGGTIVLIKPVCIKLQLPRDVDEAVDDDLPIPRKTYWRLGDAIDPKAFKKPALTDPDF